MKYAFVTGAGRGLGKGFVDYLSEQDCFVFAGVREIKTEHKNSENLEYVVCDISNDDAIQKCFETISSKTNSLDLIINNAGVNKDSITNDHKEKVSELKHLDRKLILKMFDINTISPIIITQKFLSLLKSDPCFVISISSCRSSTHDEFENGYPNYGYAASKCGLNMMTFRLSKELPKNIRAFTVHPGNVKTDMNQHGDQLPYDQAKNILNITKIWKEEFNGKFMNWNGVEYKL